MLSIVEKINKVLLHYDLGMATNSSLLSGGYANENYRITTNKGTFLYRLCKQQTLEMIKYEIDLMTRLKKIHFPAAYAFKNKHDEFYTSSQEGFAMIYEFKVGKEPDLNERTVKEVAIAIGKLNSISEYEGLEFKKNVIHIEDCKMLVKAFPNAKYSYPDVFDVFEKKTEEIEPILAKVLPKGIVHGDVFPNNTIFNEDELSAIIDFEEACIDHLLFDVGMTINGFCYIDNQLDLTLLAHFIKCYIQVRPLTQEEFYILPEYIQWGALGMSSWHLRYDMLNIRNDQQVARVQQLLQRVTYIDQNMAEVRETIQKFTTKE